METLIKHMLLKSQLEMIKIDLSFVRKFKRRGKINIKILTYQTILFLRKKQHFI